ncbi:MAG: prephenate dehydratase [Bacteroidota bacterium]
MQSTVTATKRVAIQGVKGAFHEIAARKFFGDKMELDMCESFPALFRSLDNKNSTYGVIAIENSVAGTILPNYALLRNSAFTIVGEVYLRIEHQLMALPGQKIEEITEVYTHPMALKQCQRFLEGVPHMKQVEHADTAGAAQWIATKGHIAKAAIASSLAAQYYGMEILAPSIEDNKRNFTRFLIVTDASEGLEDSSLLDKASLCFNLLHKVGYLSQVLLVLSSHGMNLAKIQSSPIVGVEWEYFFHIDLEYDDYAQYRRALEAIRPLVNELKILGEYPKGDKSGVHPSS